MPLFGERRSMLEVQNRALVKTARERSERIEQLERELREVEGLKAENDRLKAERVLFQAGPYTGGTDSRTH